MKKILQIANYKPGTGGISGQVEKIHACLDAEGIENNIFSVKGSLSYRIKAFFRLFKVGKEYDVFHIHTCSYGGFLSAVMGVTAGRLLKKRIILTYHGGGGEQFFEKHTKLVKHYLLRTDVNIVLSGFLGEVFDRFSIPYREIPNIIELDHSRFRERTVINPSFISIRSLEELYNIECILRAFKSVVISYPEATLSVLGGGSQKERLEAFVKENNIPNVAFYGRIDNSQIYEYLDKADIMLSAPRIDNMPVSLLEAFNAGLLVISSRVGGVPYLIEDGVSGFLFESDNSEELAEKMISAITDQEHSRQMIASAHSGLGKYSWENVKEKLFEAYRLEN